jgi:hypothetical protein
MTFNEFVTAVIDGGLASIQEDPNITRRPARLEGARQGFELCRGKLPTELAGLLNESARLERDALEKTMSEDGVEEGTERDAAFMHAQYRHLQIEWVCNCVSAALWNQGLPTIIAPTARGLMRAAEILGVAEGGMRHVETGYEGP